jgi:hypothetical protein
LHDGKLFLLPETFDRSRHFVRGVPLPEEPPWPRQSPEMVMSVASILPVPEPSVFTIPEKSTAKLDAVVPLIHHVEQSSKQDQGVDEIGRLISIEASAAKRIIPGSVPVTAAGLH